MNIISISSELRYPTVYINSDNSFNAYEGIKSLRSGLYTEDLKLILPYNNGLHIVYKGKGKITIHNKTGYSYCYKYKFGTYGFYFFINYNILFKFISFENGEFL